MGARAFRSTFKQFYKLLIGEMIRFSPCAIGVVACAALGGGVAPCGEVLFVIPAALFIGGGAAAGGRVVLRALAGGPILRIGAVPLLHIGHLLAIERAGGDAIPLARGGAAHGGVFGIIREGRSGGKRRHHPCTSRQICFHDLFPETFCAGHIGLGGQRASGMR